MHNKSFIDAIHHDISKFQWKINTRAKSKRSRKTSFSRKQVCFRSPSHSQKKSSSRAGFYEAFAVPRTVTIGTYRFTCTWRERLVKLNREKNVFSSLLPLCITIAPPSRNFNEGNLRRRMRLLCGWNPFGLVSGASAQFPLCAGKYFVYEAVRTRSLASFVFSFEALVQMKITDRVYDWLNGDYDVWSGSAFERSRMSCNGFCFFFFLFFFREKSFFFSFFLFFCR